MVHHFTAADGARLAFRDEGRGQALLCLAGLTRNMADFNDLAGHLRGVRLIAMDYRGRGASEWTGPETYSVPQEAQDALALIDHLGLSRVAVLGASRGGLVALAMAALAPGRLAGIFFNDVGPVIEPAGLARIFDYLGRRPAAKTLAEAAARMPRALPGFAGVAPARWLAEAERQFTQGPEGLGLTYDARLREPFLAAFSGPAPDLWPLYDACAGLVLGAIRGAGSDILSAATLAEMARRRPDLIWAEVPGRGHMPFLDEPESLATLRRFLAALA